MTQKLRRRMVLSLFLLGLFIPTMMVLVTFFISLLLYPVSYLFLSIINGSSIFNPIPFFIDFYPTLFKICIVPITVIVLWIAYYEFKQGPNIILDEIGAPLTEIGNDSLTHNRVQRLSALLNVNSPTVLIAETDIPHALTVGLANTEMCLVLSRSVLEECNDKELDAVIAHELAHIKNRDVTVMTILSIPTTVARQIKKNPFGPNSVSMFDSSDASDQDGDSSNAEMAIWERAIVGLLMINPLSLIFLIFITPIYDLSLLLLDFVGQALLASVSRVRELAADRIAAETIGSPEHLTIAIHKLSDKTESIPEEDLRRSRASNAFEIVQPGPVIDIEFPELGPEGNWKPFLYGPRKRYRELQNHYFRTHPDITTRIEALEDHKP